MSPLRPLAVSVWLLVLASASHSAAADSIARRDAAAKIAPWVLDRASQTSIECLVVLADRADLTPATTMPPGSARRRFVRDALYSTARASQASLVAWLEEHGVEHRSFYIVDALWVKAPIAILDAIAQRPDVARIEGNPTIQVVAPESPELDRAAAAPTRVSAPETVEPGIASIRAPNVWAMGFTGQNVVIGGADTGVQWDHPALKAKYRGWNGVSAVHDYNWHDSVHTPGGGGACGPDSPVPCDDTDHGTHTLGTAVGEDGVNQIGVAPGARFIACRNMDQGNGTPASYLECMEWFLAPYPVGGTTAEGDPDLAPDITTNSWGCPLSEGCVASTLQQGVEAQRAAGIMFVGAAGNSGSGCSTVSDPPAIYDATYTVGAYNAATNLLASFSSRGPVTVDGSNRLKPDITAPGVSVRSAIPGGLYASFSGTSMATPHVAGAVALLWSARPALTNQISQTEDLLNQNAVHHMSTLCSSSGNPSNLYGWGQVDINAAVNAVPPVSVASRTPPVVSGVWLGPAAPNPSHHAALLRFRLEQAGAARVTLYASDGRRMRTIPLGEQSAGDHALRWDGMCDGGAIAAPGLYLVQLESRGLTANQKIIWLGR